MNIGYALLITVVSVISLAVMMYFIWKSDTTKLQKLVFSSFGVNVIIYIISLYLSNIQFSPAIDLLTNRLVFAVVPLFTVSLLILLSSFYKDSQKNALALAIVAVTGFFISLTGLVVNEVTYSPVDLVYSIKSGPLYIPYIIFAIVPVAWAVYDIWKNSKLLTGNTKLRLRTISLVTFAVIILFALTNFVLPVFLGSSRFSQFATLWILLWVIGLYYSIVKYRLFDVKFLTGQIMIYLINGFVFFATFWGSYYLQIYLWKTLFSIESYAFGFILAVVFYSIYKGFTPTILKFVDTTFGLGIDSRGEYENRFIIDLASLVSMDKINKELEQLVYKFLDAQSYLLVIINKEKISKSGLLKIHDKDVTTFVESAVKMPNAKNGFVLDAGEIAKISTFAGVEAAAFAVNQETTIVLFFGPKVSERAWNNQDYTSIEHVWNSVVSAVKRSLLYQEVQTFSATLQQRVNEATADLQQKNADLKRLRDRERDMMDIMGHELRTPLTIIKMTLGLLKTKAEKLDAKFDKNEFDTYYVRMKEAIEREIRLLETMLSSTKLDANRMEIHLEKVDFLPMIKDAMLAQQEKAEEKGLKFIFDDPEVPIEVFADRVRLPEIIDNLVSNAVKYTEEGHVKIKIDTDSLAGHVLVAVSDTGIGIPEDALPHLGTKFFRVQQHLEKVHQDAERKPAIVRPGGTGLGLHVSFGLAEMMGGKVLVESEIGKGSTFTIKIPKYLNQEEVDFREKGRDAFARMGLTKKDGKAVKESKKPISKSSSKLSKEDIKPTEKDSHLSVAELLAQESDK